MTSYEGEGKVFMITKGFDEVDQSDKEQILNHDILDSLNKFIGSDPFAQYLSEYLQNTMKNIERIGLAVASRDDVRIRHLAHKLKGSSGNIGALKLAWNCMQLEATTVEEKSEDVVCKQFNELESVFQDTKTAIESYIENLPVSHPNVA